MKSVYYEGKFKSAAYFMASGSVLQTSEEPNYILCFSGSLPRIKRSACNHLMMLGRDEEFMPFLGISRSAFEVLLHSFDFVRRRRRKRLFSL